MTPLPSSFYDRNPLLVAPELLGKILVRKIGNKIISGRIVEVEAYLASRDPASHSFKGLTKRSQSLFKPGGHAYIYSIHQQHCLDIVTENKNTPTSVLIRALEPLQGIDIMKKLRNKEDLRDLTSGPGKLCQALQINKDFDSQDLTDPSSDLIVVNDNFVLPMIVKSKRIGITKATDLDYRFYLKDSPYISRK